MAMSKQTAQALAAYARATRDWDEAGCMAALGAVHQMDATTVALAWVRLCGTPEVKTPGAFANMGGPQWSERAKATETYRPPKAHEACQLCGRWLESCICEAPTVRRPEASSNRDAILAQIRAESRERRRAMCAHGVPREHCTEHGGTRSETAVRATESAAEPFSGTPEGDSASASVSGAEIGAAS